MNYPKIFLLLLFLQIIGLTTAFAQTNTVPLKTLADRKSDLSYNYPSESVYLHFDKPYYAVGDTIWFKAYLTIQQHLPSPISKIVYVELINRKDSLIETLKLPVSNSVANGSIVLNYTNFKEGSYHIRAYTRWMMNFNEAYFFKKNIYVGDAINKSLITQISFNGNISEKTQKVSSKVTYKDELGKPLADKKVSWEVYADGERLAKGRETTDSQGNININFSGSTQVGISKGTLTTAIDVGDRKILNSTFPLKTAILENDIQFFPEGGELIAGLVNRVAFKAIRSDGLGIGIKGRILDEAGKEVVAIASQHLGMGSFVYTPQTGKKYSAEIIFADQSKKTFKLPEAKEDGLALSTKNVGDSLQINISANQSYLANNLKQSIYIVAQNGGVLYYAAQTALRKPNFSVMLSHDQFPTGVIQVALLKSDGMPINERLIFSQRKDDVKINLKPDQLSYTGRQKVKIDIQTTSGLNPAAGSYSVAVVNDSQVPVDENNETTIKSNLLLSSDLEGYIENPNYYFFKSDEQKKADLDVLLLTQGYRRFTYKDLAADKKPIISAALIPEQGINISGTIRKSNGMPLENGRILFQIPDKRFNTTGNTDKEGKFKFTNLIFNDSSEVVVNARNNLNSKDLRITIDGESYPSLYANINAPDDILNIDSAFSTYLKYSRIEHQSAFMLKEVVVKSQAVKKVTHNDFSALTGLNMMADREVSGTQLQGCRLLTDCLSSAGLTYIDHMLYLTRTYNQGIKVPVEIYVNGMPVDVNYLTSVEVSGVESIEVFNSDGLTGINKRSNTSGVVVVNMKEVKKSYLNKDQLKDLFPPTNVLTFSPKGYSVERQFYAPKYSGPRNTLQREDYRSTIYWNPNIITDKDGKSSFEYFNGDVKGTYRLVIEGIDDSGNIGRSVFRYQLK